jgi:hypothetical protein
MATVRRGLARSIVLAAVLIAAAVTGSSALADPAPALTSAEMHRLDLYLQKIGNDQRLDPVITLLLGLTKPDQTMTFRQIVGNDDADPLHLHYFSRSEDQPNVIVFLYLDKSTNTMWGYLTDPQFRYIKSYVSKDAHPFVMTPQDGGPKFAVEIRWWAKELDAAPDP